MRPTLLAALVIAATLGGPVRAQAVPVAEPGEWIEVTGARLRVVLGSAQPDGTVEGAVEVDLQPGWKTYWVAPGPFGIPPTFDAARSQNLALAAVDYPAPRAFEEYGEVSVGYKEDVAFPLTFAVADPAAPARLALSGFLGVCETICVPVAFAVEGDVVSGQSTPLTDSIAIRSARAALPPKGLSGRIAARVEDDAILLSGAAIADETQAFVAPPAGLSLDVARREGAEIRAPIRKGEPEGVLDVVLRDGPTATRYRVPIVN